VSDREQEFFYIKSNWKRFVSEGNLSEILSSYFKKYSSLDCVGSQIKTVPLHVNEIFDGGL
jgi:hypothetical protein